MSNYKLLQLERQLQDSLQRALGHLVDCIFTLNLFIWDCQVDTCKCTADFHYLRTKPKLNDANCKRRGMYVLVKWLAKCSPSKVSILQPKFKSFSSIVRLRDWRLKIFEMSTNSSCLTIIAAFSGRASHSKLLAMSYPHAWQTVDSTQHKKVYARVSRLVVRRSQFCILLGVRRSDDTHNLNKGLATLAMRQGGNDENVCGRII